jgi:hypothetical protein
MSNTPEAITLEMCNRISLHGRDWTTKSKSHTGETTPLTSIQHGLHPFRSVVLTAIKAYNVVLLCNALLRPCVRLAKSRLECAADKGHRKASLI